MVIGLCSSIYIVNAYSIKQPSLYKAHLLSQHRGGAPAKLMGQYLDIRKFLSHACFHNLILDFL